MRTVLFLTTIALFLVFSIQVSSQDRRFNPEPDATPSVHDPVVAKCGDTYYLFCTGFGISVLSSTDMINWKREQSVFSEAPAWAVEAVPGYRGHTWAPDIIKHNDTYYLYYSVSTFGKNNSCIGLATNKTLDPNSADFEWKDQGMVVQSIPNRDMWNAIDPNIIMDENGTAWMSFGSFWEGLKLVKLDSSLCALAEPQEWYPLSRRPRTINDIDVEPGGGAVEAPYIFRKGNFYYLFVSFDMCCRGAQSTYNIVVGRSKKVTGPYVDKEGNLMTKGAGSLVVKGNERFPGVGHNAVVSFDSKDYLFFHGYDMERNGRSILLIREISWDEQGWPTVEL